MAQGWRAAGIGGLVGVVGAVLAAACAPGGSVEGPEARPARAVSTIGDSTSLPTVSIVSTVPVETTAARTTTTTVGPTTTTPPPTTATTTTTTTTTNTTTTTTVPWSVAPGAFAQFDATLASKLVGRGAFGLSVAVARDGQMVHTAGLGVANGFTGEPVTTSSTFRIASVSKTLLALTVMQLVDEGALRLNEPVLESLAAHLGTRLGDPAMRATTIHHLLGHVSGFPQYARTFFGGIVGSCADAARRGLERELIGVPGSVYRYSNMNYCVLGQIVEQVTGRPYSDEIEARVLRPLGITDMRIGTTASAGPHEVLHATTPGRNFLEALGPAGAWVGTPQDLVRILDAVPAGLAATMTKPAAMVPYPDPDRWYGLGLIVYDGGRSWGHTGSVEGARAMVVHRGDGITWAVLVNGNVPSDADRLRAYVEEALATVTWSAAPSPRP